MLTSAQIRAARALVRMEQAKLAQSADVSVETVKRLERLDGPLDGAKAGTLAAIQRALESAGVEFTDGDKPGVRLNDKAAALSEAEFYIIAHSDKFARSGPKLLSDAEKSSRVTSIEDGAVALRQATSWKQVEEALEDLKDYGFSLPNALVAKLVSAFREPSKS